MNTTERTGRTGLFRFDCRTGKIDSGLNCNNGGRAKSKNDGDSGRRRARILILLFMLLSVSSWSLGFLIGRIDEYRLYKGRIIDTIVISSSQDAGALQEAPIEINIIGRIVYSDGTPYANGTVEIRSEPRYTTTDSLGYFVFENAEAGEHIISVVENNAVVSSSTVRIERNQNLDASQLIKLSNNSYVIQIAVKVIHIEILMTLDNNNLTISPDIRVITKDTDSVPPDRAPGINVSTYPGDTNWTQSTSIDIFYNRAGAGGHGAGAEPEADARIIAPGSEGKYVFKVSNPEAFDITYSLRMTESDMNVPGLPMKYRLSEGVSSSAGLPRFTAGVSWRSAADIFHGGIRLQPGENRFYTLEWRWDPSDDARDTAIGTQPEPREYVLNIIIDADFSDAPP